MKEFIQELSNDELAEILGAGICICGASLQWDWCPNKDDCDAWCISHGGVRTWSDPDSNSRGSVLGSIFGSCFK